MENKEQIFINNLLKRINNGESKEKLEKEYYEIINEKEDSKSLTYSNNPLILLAEENGAIRALKESINFECTNNEMDEISNSLLHIYLNRLSDIKLHYDKIQALVVNRLDKYYIIPKGNIKSNEEKVIETLKYLTSFEGNYNKEEIQLIKSVLEQIEEIIDYENNILLPLLDELISDDELLNMYIEEFSMGFAFINVKFDITHFNN